MMSISHSDLMPIRSERSDAGLSQFEIVIEHQSRLLLVFSFLAGRILRFPGSLWFWALTEGARRATGVSAQNHFAIRPLLGIFAPTTILLFSHRLSL
jgi:hypothetical protein